MTGVLSVRPFAGPSGFSWWVVRVVYSNWKTDSSGGVRGFGTPRHERVAGPFSQLEALRALEALGEGA